MGIMMQSFWWRQVYREWLVISRNRQALLNSMLFFMMFIVFFPLSIPYSPTTLRFICPGIVFLALTFAIFLSSERFYQTDTQTGWMELWMVHRYSLLSYVYSKWFIHGIVMMFGMMLTIPFIGLMYQLNVLECIQMLVIVLLAIPTLIALCGLVNAFGAFGPHRSLVMLLILLPLLLPLIILGSSAISASLSHLPILPYLALLLALSISMQFLLGLASAQILKICIEYP